ncbi:MAG: TolC family protein [Gemmatimonadaceae bacterium]
MTRARSFVVAVNCSALCASCLATGAAAQEVRANRDSVSYRELLTAATSTDPRQRQLGLQQSASQLRLRSIAAERLPSLGVTGQAQYQSEVTRIAIPLPGVSIPTPPNDTYDAHLSAQQSLLDPTLDSRRAMERARLAESQAHVRATLFGIRQEVAEAFFAAAAMEQRIEETDAAIADLEARRRETVTRYRNGAALRGDTAAIAATITERRQDRLALVSERSTALARLALLTGRSLRDDVVLLAPASAALVRHVANALDTLRARPEYEQFAATRDRLEQQSRLVASQEKPRVSAFGRLGYGRPGLNMLSADFQTYWVAGVQLEWTPFNWGTANRDREQLALEREIVTTNEAAFSRSLARSVQPTLASIARLDSTIALDESVIALREQVAHEAQVQLREGVITAATYVDHSTALLTARLRRVQHRVALEQARVTLLNTLGVEVR